MNRPATEGGSVVAVSAEQFTRGRHQTSPRFFRRPTRRPARPRVAAALPTSSRYWRTRMSKEFKEFKKALRG